uniref:Lipid droplet-associated hydrolase n=1 Tax=Equus caballus TaxID=9796 RepID=A0A9L0T2Y6_HORSE
MDSEIKEEIPVHEEFILCCGVETQVLKCGPWTDLFNDQSANRPKLLIFVITGNPGFSAAYVPFVKALYSSVNKRFPVWVISHAGHALAPKDKKILTTSDGAGPVVQWLSSHIPLLRGRGSPVWIPGADMAPLARHAVIIRSLLLFPTIERMSESPNGRIATPLFCRFRYALYVSAYLLLKPWPEKIKSLMIRKYLQMMNLQTEFSLLNMLEPFCLVNAAYLASQEMMDVVKRDNETIKEHLSKLTFYYGTVDAWCPKEYYEDMKKDFPEGDIRLCEKKIPHAFVLGFHQEMADMVADWLKDDLSKI